MYPGENVSMAAECEAAVTTRTIPGWVRFMEYGELLCGKSFPLKLNSTVHKCYVRHEF